MNKVSLPQKFYAALRKNHEHGFTLVEIAAALVIIGILAAIAIPVIINQLNATASNEIKADLIQAAGLIEQERIDNNGLYPTYMPNEVKANPDWAKFSYSYSDNRLVFCLQGEAPDGWWFVGSTSKEASRAVCTQKNFGEGSTPPWGEVIVPTAAMSTATTSWAFTDTDARGNGVFTAGTCANGTTSYQMRVTNTTAGGEIVSPWSTSKNVTVILTGWQPNDAVSFQARAKCAITYGGSNYDFNGEWSTEKTTTVKAFTVPTPTNWAATPSISITGTSAKANWSANAIVCPIGTAVYNFSTLQAKAGGGNYISSTAYNAAKSGSLSLSSPQWDTAITMRLSQGCQLDSGALITSAQYTDPFTGYFVGIPTPTGSLGFKATANNGATSVIPNRLEWTAPTCLAGTFQANAKSTDTAIDSGWITDLFYNITLTNGQTRTFNLTGQCVGTNMNSSIASFGSVSVTGVLSTPSAPPAMTASNGGKGLVNENVTFTFAANTCPASIPNETYYLYRAGVLIGTTAPNVTTFTTALPSTTGSYAYTYKYSCSNGSYDTNQSAVSPTYTENVYVQPAAPTGFSLQRMVGRTANINFAVTYGTTYTVTLVGAPNTPTYNAWKMSSSSTWNSMGGGSSFTISGNGTGTVNVVIDPVGPTNQGWSSTCPGCTANQAKPVLQVVATKDGYNSPTTSFTIDAPRMRLYKNQNDTIQRSTCNNTGSCIDTRYSNSLVSYDGVNAFTIHANGNPHIWNFVAGQIGWSQGRTDVGYTQYDGNWAYRSTSGTLLACLTPGCDGMTDMMAMESDGYLRAWMWNGSGFVSRYNN